jgi:hypothetical protein
MVKCFKKIIVYTLLLSVLLAYNYKTINYYIKLTDNTASFCSDYDCEEKNADSEKFGDKNEKKDVSEYLPINKTHAFVLIHQLSFNQRSKNLYVSSDYSMAVFSPPDQATT